MTKKEKTETEILRDGIRNLRNIIRAPSHGGMSYPEISGYLSNILEEQEKTKDSRKDKKTVDQILVKAESSTVINAMEHKLKLDIKFWDGVKSGKKNYEIRKNDRDFKVGDTLILKAWTGDSTTFPHEYAAKQEGGGWAAVDLEWQADTITAKVIGIASANFVNEAPAFVDCVPQSIKWPNSTSETYIKDIRAVLQDYFHTDKLPDDYVVLGIEVEK